MSTEQSVTEIALTNNASKPYHHSKHIAVRQKKYTKKPKQLESKHVSQNMEHGNFDGKFLFRINKPSNAGTVVFQQEGHWFESWLGQEVFLCGGVGFLMWVLWLSLVSKDMPYRCTE